MLFTNRTEKDEAKMANFAGKSSDIYHVVQVFAWIVKELENNGVGHFLPMKRFDVVDLFGIRQSSLAKLQIFVDVVLIEKGEYVHICDDLVELLRHWVHNNHECVLGLVSHDASLGHQVTST